MIAKKIEAKQFKNISLRGRVAYSICCLENALEHYGITGEGWNYLLRKMWSYTEWSINLYSWFGELFLTRWKRISKIQPKMFRKSLKFYEKNEHSHFADSYPNQDETKALLLAYKQTNSIINQISNIIFKMSISERWQEIDKDSSATLRLLQKIINIMYKKNIELPNIEQFEQYVFYKSGWKKHIRGLGEPFNGKQYSKFLKNEIVDKYDFVGISIRGRVAYGICCLENILEHFDLKGEGWNFLLRKLWWYTELSAESDPSIDNCLQLERWAYLSANIAPNSVESFKDYNDFSKKGKWWFKDNIPTEEEYQLLKNTYLNCNETIKKICKNINYIGTRDLWAGIDDVSEVTLCPLQEILDIMYEQSIPLPPIEPFRQYVFDNIGWDYDLHGFGEMFDGTQYSKFVNSTK